MRHLRSCSGCSLKSSPSGPGESFLPSFPFSCSSGWFSRLRYRPWGDSFSWSQIFVGQGPLTQLAVVTGAFAITLFRFRLPILVFGLAVSATLLVFTYAMGHILPLQAFLALAACGIACLVAGIWLDSKDRSRTGPEHEWALWLFVVGSPLTVHAIMLHMLKDYLPTVMGFFGGGCLGGIDCKPVHRNRVCDCIGRAVIHPPRADPGPALARSILAALSQCRSQLCRVQRRCGFRRHRRRRAADHRTARYRTRTGLESIAGICSALRAICPLVPACLKVDYMTSLTPREIVSELDRFIIGQKDAKTRRRRRPAQSLAQAAGR